jgi:hypothetical protein
MTKTFKYTVNPDHLVTRSIPIAWESDAERDEALATLAAMPFVQAASFDAAASALSVEYDASHEDIGSIEAWLTGHGAHLLGGWRRVVLDAWHKFQDHAQAAAPTPDDNPVVHTAPQSPRGGRPLRRHRP